MCGIAGIINKTARAFDYSAFCILGIANDSRGGDSCGVFIDGKYEYGIGETKLFSNYFLNSDLLDSVDRASIALLHCRKASIGAISEETAQPVVLTDDYGNVEFVVLHNGTIHNYKELAKKYIPDIDIAGMTDSQVMARIFYYAGYDVLNEYNGGAVFAIVDYRGYSPKVMLFKGASKKTKYSEKMEEERPLFYCIDKTKRELVFSSIGLHLVALRKDLSVYTLTPNVLCEFNGKGLTAVKRFSRENTFQQKDYGKGYYDYSSFYFDGPSDNYITSKPGTNTYESGGKAMHGRFYITQWGRIESHSKKDPKNYEVYFFEGVPLKGVNCFRFLSTLMRDSRLATADFVKKFENVIRYLSLDGVFKKNGKWYKAISPTGSTLFTGTLQRIGTIAKTECVSGTEISSSFNGDYKYLGEVVSAKHDINFKKVREECKSLMK